MIANISWKIIQVVCGMLAAYSTGAISTSRSMANRKPPTNALPSANARLYPTSAQTTLTTPIRMKHCIRTDSTFFRRTSPE
jgi:hypothetical protein